YNDYYNWILDWDSSHVFGLVNHLRRTQAQLSALGGGNTVDWYWQGAMRWIHYNGRRGVYQYYFTSS
ncbi:MAG: hypothetical protein AAF804_16020, partial [Bacteroidota bacterium]